MPTTTMRALHLPGLKSPSSKPPFSFPSPTPPASSLIFTPNFPKPSSPSSSSNAPPTNTGTHYLIKTTHTALTRGELTWDETLFPHRWTTSGGAIPGHDLIGTVAEIFPVPSSPQPQNAKFSIGQKVAALLAFNRDGAAAEFALAEEGELALLPSSLGEGGKVKGEEVAAVPLSGLSAWQGIFEHGGVDEGRLSLQSDGKDGDLEKPRVLVLGASGSVGVMAVQIAKAAGCWVVGTASTRNVEFVRGLGADEVVDYTVEKDVAALWGRGGWEGVDLVVDTVGKKSLLGAIDEKVLKKGAKIVSYVEPFEGIKGEEAEGKGKVLEGLVSKVHFFIVRPDGEQLAKLLELVGDGRVKGQVEKVLKLEDGTAAMELVEQGKARGKVVLAV